MTESLTWSDLGLTARERAALEPYALSEPEAVVSLAQGSPDLLSRVIPVETVHRLALVRAKNTPDSSQSFSLGVPLSEPAFNVLQMSNSAEFESRRTALLAQLEAARSPSRQKMLMQKIERLYGTSPRSTTGRARSGRP